MSVYTTLYKKVCFCVQHDMINDSFLKTRICQAMSVSPVVITVEFSITHTLTHTHTHTHTHAHAHAHTHTPEVDDI